MEMMTNALPSQVLDFCFDLRDRVLSIQSHVTYGYVGGKAAVFPLQCLGFDVDVVNTVNFSNHSGYGRFGGSKATALDLTSIFDTMEANGLLAQERLLTGYIPGAEALSVIAKLAKRIKTKNPEMIYLLDPVLGDSGKLYVAPDVIPIYRELLPQATIITPNWFEVETLTNMTLKDMPSLRRALRILHEELRVPHVVMSSIPLHDFLRDALPIHLLPEADTSRPIDSTSHLICISSSYRLSANCSAADETSKSDAELELSTVHAHALPCIPGYFSGVGDLFSALVLAHFHPIHTPGSSTSSSSTTSSPTTQAVPANFIDNTSHTPLSVAVSLALSKTFALLRLTHEHVCSSCSAAEDVTDEERDRTDPERRVRRMRTRELRLVQGQSLLRAVPTPISSANDSNAAELREMRSWSGFWRHRSASNS